MALITKKGVLIRRLFALQSFLSSAISIGLSLVYRNDFCVKNTLLVAFCPIKISFRADHI